MYPSLEINFPSYDLSLLNNFHLHALILMPCSLSDAVFDVVDYT